MGSQQPLPTGSWRPSPPYWVGSIALPQGCVSTGILATLCVADNCSLSEFDENFLFFFILNGKKIAHFKPHVFFIHFWGWVGGSEQNVD